MSRPVHDTGPTYQQLHEYRPNYVEDLATIVVKRKGVSTPQRYSHTGKDVMPDDLQVMLTPGARQRALRRILAYSENMSFPFEDPSECHVELEMAMPAYWESLQPYPNPNPAIQELSVLLGVPSGETDRPPSPDAKIYWDARTQKSHAHPDGVCKVYGFDNGRPLRYPMLTGCIYYDMSALASKRHMSQYFLLVCLFLQDMMSLGVSNITTASLSPVVISAIGEIWRFLAGWRPGCKFARQMYLLFLHLQQNVTAPILESSPFHKELFEKYAVCYGGRCVPLGVQDAGRNLQRNAFRLLPRCPRQMLGLRSIMYDRVYHCRKLGSQVLLCDAQLAAYDPEAFEVVQNKCMQQDVMNFYVPLSLARGLPKVTWLKCLNDLEDYMDLLPENYSVEVWYDDKQYMFGYSRDCLNKLIGKQTERGAPNDPQKPLFSSGVNTYVPLGEANPALYAKSFRVYVHYANSDEERLRSVFPSSQEGDAVLAAVNVLNLATPCYNLERRFLTSVPDTTHALYELYNLVFTPGLSQLFWEAPQDCATKAKARFTNPPLPHVNWSEPYGASRRGYLLERTEHKASYTYVMRNQNPRKKNRIFAVPKPSKMAEYMWKIKPAWDTGLDCKAHLTGNLFEDLNKIQSYKHAAYHLTAANFVYFHTEMYKEQCSVRDLLLCKAEESGFSHKSPLPDVLFIYKLLLRLRAEVCAIGHEQLYLCPNYPVLPPRVLLSLLNATHGRPLKELACVEVLHQHDTRAYGAVKAASEWDLNAYRLLVLGGPRSRNKGDEPDFEGRPAGFNIMTAAQNLQAYLSSATFYSACYPPFDMEKVTNLYLDLVDCQAHVSLNDNYGRVDACRDQYLKAYKTSCRGDPSDPDTYSVGKQFIFWDPAQNLSEILRDRARR